MLLLWIPTLAADNGVVRYLAKDDAWFVSPECRRIADNIVSHQGEAGGWPKNTATGKSPFEGNRGELKASFDNGATTGEIRFLARGFSATGNPIDAAAALKGISHILEAQYGSGGWPQFHPPGKDYHRHITFNDGSIVRIMELLREVARDPHFDFVPRDQRDLASAAFGRGVECILKCQIRVDGRPTVWCAQHDGIDLAPRAGRSYELAAFSGSESVGIVRLLMAIPQPSDRVVEAIEGAVAWLDAARIRGIRIASENGDRIVVAEPQAPDLWARFYDLESGRPVFADRDGVPKASLAEIGHERRTGYSWYGNWPEKLLERDYPAWRKRQGR